MRLFWILFVPVVGNNLSKEGDEVGARRMKKASYGLSTAGIITGIIIIILFVFRM